MRLAGQMRLSTFLTLAGVGVVVVGAAAIGGVGFYASTRPDPPVPVEAPRAPAVPPPSPVEATPAPIPAPVPTAAGMRAVDEVVFSYRGKALGTDKLKDVTQGRPYKVNVYQDAGQPTANRAKIDLNRNDKWDEKITFEPDRVTRQVASADDEVYDQTFHWDGSTWAPAQ